MARHLRTDVAPAILQYLRAHPGAAGTIENVCRLWVPEGFHCSRTDVDLAIQTLMAEGHLRTHLQPDGTLLFRQRVRSITERLVRFLGLVIVGESLQMQWPSAFWELRAPRIESDTESETLVLDVRDIRYPRLRGKLYIKVSPTHASIRWRTRLPGNAFRLDRPLIISDDGLLRGPLDFGRLFCDAEETNRIRAFLDKQRPLDNDDAAPLAVPHDPIRPRGGLSNAAAPDT